MAGNTRVLENDRTAAALPSLPHVSTLPPTKPAYSLQSPLVVRKASLIVFVVAAVGYAAVGWWMAMDLGYYLGDALSRTQDAQSALFSRDSGLAGIGFVFTPLTTILQMPLVALSPWEPALTRAGLAGMVVSALFMAGAVREIWLIAVERGVKGRYALLLTGLFAVHPLIVFYGAVGMSEAPFIFATLLAARRLIRWSSTDDVHDLIVAGCALAIAFLARYDALVMTFFAMLLVGAMTWRARGRRTMGDRVGFAVADMVLLVSPSGFVFVTWILVGWLTTGELVAQFTSAYGNSAIIAESGGGASGWPAVMEALVRMLIVAPVLPLLLVVSAWLVLRRHDLEPLFPCALMIPVIFFQILSYATGSTFGLLRFFIICVPLCFILLIQISLPTDVMPFPSQRPGAAFRWRAVNSRAYPTALLPIMVVLAVASVPVTVKGMASPSWAPQEFAVVRAVAVDLWGDDLSNNKSTGAEQSSFLHETLAEYTHRLRVQQTFSTEAAVADYLDSLNLGEGEVLTSTTFGFAVLTASQNQKQFVIPSDQDFLNKLDDPARFGVRYILVAPGTGRGASDPITLRHPGLYDSGDGIGVLDVEFPNEGDGQPDWRLYRVLVNAE